MRAEWSGAQLRREGFESNSCGMEPSGMEPSASEAEWNGAQVKRNGTERKWSGMERSTSEAEWNGAQVKRKWNGALWKGRRKVAKRAELSNEFKFHHISLSKSNYVIRNKFLIHFKVCFFYLLVKWHLTYFITISLSPSGQLLVVLWMTLAFIMNLSYNGLLRTHLIRPRFTKPINFLSETNYVNRPIFITQDVG